MQRSALALHVLHLLTRQWLVGCWWSNPPPPRRCVRGVNLRDWQPLWLRSILPISLRRQSAANKD
eukprot:1743261-Amphidinium_carterae.1